VHLDECASSYRLRGLLAAHGFEVTMTHEAGLLKAADRRQLKYSVSNRMIIVTYDRDFLAFHEAGATHAGIIHSPQDPIYDHEILRILLRMAGEVSQATREA
jgi:predicted nuclease of predicted toxin-antitoxin system